MLALGCLFPVAFFLGGAVLGAMLGGQPGSIWGAVSGLLVGISLPAAIVFALKRKGGAGK